MRAHHAPRTESVIANASPAASDSGTRRNADGGNGWVGEATSPGTSLVGTGRPSTGRGGTPLLRSRTKRGPILVATPTPAEEPLPPPTASSHGAAGTSSPPT